jgi:hypothetical protein
MRLEEPTSLRQLVFQATNFCAQTMERNGVRGFQVTAVAQKLGLKRADLLVQTVAPLQIGLLGFHG